MRTTRSRNHACEHHGVGNTHANSREQEPNVDRGQKPQHPLQVGHTISTAGRNHNEHLIKCAMLEINKIGPFAIGDLTRTTVADVVINQKAPMVVSEVVDGITNYAVIAQRDLKILCVGCFKPGMTLTDDRRCRTCSSFVNHWDNTNSERRLNCKPANETIEEVANTCPGVILAFDNTDPVEISNDVILDDVNRRNLTALVVENANNWTFPKL